MNVLPPPLFMTATLVHSRRRRDAHAIARLLAACAAIAIASVAGAGALHRSADAREIAARTLRVETQVLERRMHRLDAPGADALLENLVEGRDAVRVRLVEALEQARARYPGEPGMIDHRIEERAMGEGESVATLRLTLEGRTVHGSELLDLLASVVAAGAPWPAETRGCLVQRVDARDGGGDARRITASKREPTLLFRCVVDLLHWQGLDPT